MLLSVVGLLLSAFGTAAFMLPTHSGDAPRRTAADPPPAGSAAFGAALARSASASASALASAKPSATASPRPSPKPGTPSRSPRRTAPTRSAAGSPSPTAATGDTAQENRVTALVNQARAEAGCGAVRTDERLRAAARGHSRDMATKDYFSHTAPDGSTFVDRAAAAGYPRNEAGGENIAMGYRTPADVMAGWMNSAGHRANILNCDFKAIGVGLARDSGGPPYWTQVFGRS